MRRFTLPPALVADYQVKQKVNTAVQTQSGSSLRLLFPLFYDSCVSLSTVCAYWTDVDPAIYTPLGVTSETDGAEEPLACELPGALGTTVN